ncbi:hypothetical protein [Methylobacterium segetis]|nr:hypothetical protein [Methylobacterium segetis]
MVGGRMGNDPNPSDDRETGGRFILLIAFVMVVILAYGAALMMLE